MCLCVIYSMYTFKKLFDENLKKKTSQLHQETIKSWSEFSYFNNIKHHFNQNIYYKVGHCKNF